MTATQPNTTRKNSNNASKSTTRPVPAMLLELACLMHATRVVGVRETPVKASDRAA